MAITRPGASPSIARATAASTMPIRSAGSRRDMRATLRAIHTGQASSHVLGVGIVARGGRVDLGPGRQGAQVVDLGLAPSSHGALGESEQRLGRQLGQVLTGGVEPECSHDPIRIEQTYE
jgi:hypothetical protein